jgi:hypothetical protein
MRTLILVSLIFLFAPVAHAECIYDENGGWSDSSTGSACTPTSGIQTSPTNPGNPAQTSPMNPRGENIKLINPLNTGECTPNGSCLMNFLNKILDFVIKIGGVVVVLMLIYVGYLFVVAQGKEEKIREARSALLWTVIGALILLGSKAIAIGIEATVKAISVGG